jgi:hypothetical protein
MTHTSNHDGDKQPDEAWLQDTLAALNTREQQIDYVTRSRLSAARARAVETESRFRWFNLRLAVPLATMAVCALVVLNLPEQPSAPAPAPLMASQDLPILSSGEELDFYQSLELLEWMDDSYPELGRELQG